MDDPCRTKCAESGRVPAGLGGEVTAEAEHVRPLREAKAGHLGEPAEAPALSDQPACVGADVEPVQVVGRSYPPVERADAFSGLGGVLGDVAGDGLIGKV